MKRREFVGLAVVATAAGLLPRGAVASGPRMTVHKDPYCGCCEAWAAAFEDAGFAVEVRNEDDMNAVKAKLKVPSALHGCHTATVEGYYLEGHVPLEAALKLLQDKPALAGLAVAGMPKGSLGMGTDPAASYDVTAVPRNGGTPYVYASIRPK